MHTASDFILQGRVLSKLKASKFGFLLAHVGIYTFFFIVLSPVLLDLTFIQGLWFSLINGATHLVIDYFTGKLKKHYWQKSEIKYLATVTFDHALHILILIVSYAYMFPEIVKTLEMFGWSAPFAW